MAGGTDFQTAAPHFYIGGGGATFTPQTAPTGETNPGAKVSGTRQHPRKPSGRKLP